MHQLMVTISTGTVFLVHCFTYSDNEIFAARLFDISLQSITIRKAVVLLAGIQMIPMFLVFFSIDIMFSCDNFVQMKVGINLVDPFLQERICI
jgi:hypothetical protein